MDMRPQAGRSTAVTADCTWSATATRRPRKPLAVKPRPLGGIVVFARPIAPGARRPSRARSRLFSPLSLPQQQICVIAERVMQEH